MPENKGPRHKLDGGAHSKGPCPASPAPEAVCQLFSCPADGKHSPEGELKGCCGNHIGRLQCQDNGRQSHGRQQIIGLPQPGCQKGASQHQAGPEHRGAKSGHDPVTEKKPPGPQPCLSKAHPPPSQSPVKSHPNQGNMKSADCKQVGDTVFLIEVRDFLVHACLISQHNGRQKPCITLAAKALKNCPAPLFKQISSRLQRTWLPVRRHCPLCTHPTADIL